ncbi:hypothetical protein MYX75_03180 [Acidobacteria bacterium AH-259-A15]|nr:hypothetical protein [Acidobacteria bacterium AH-259-A15]
MHNKQIACPLSEVRTGLNCQRGFSILSLVAALLIIGLLYVTYMNLGSGTETAKMAITAKTAGRGVACQMNRQAAERAIMTWSISHPGTQPTLEALKRERIPITPCPEGGQFRLEGREVRCSIHSTSD